MKKLINYFLQGLIYIAPLAITVYIIYVVFTFINDILDATVRSITNINFPGLGIISLIILLVLIGIIGQTIIAKPFHLFFKRLLNRAPLLKVIYTALTDLFSAFVGKEKKFNKPVLVLINPISNLEKLGFVTEESISKITTDDKVAVYFPHSYNFSGELFIVPRNQVKLLDINPADVMKFIISGGVAGLEEQEKKQ